MKPTNPLQEPEPSLVMEPELCQPFLLQGMEKQTSKFYFHWKWFIPLTFTSFAARRVWAVEQLVGLNSAGILYFETSGWGYKK